MKQKKVISLPTNSSKIYRQILAFMNFMLNITQQERDVLAEIIKLDREYESLPQDKRGKFILSQEMRTEMCTSLGLPPKQFNVIVSRLRNKTLFGKPLIGDNCAIHPELLFTPDEEGFRIEVNFVNTQVNNSTPVKEEPKEEEERSIPTLDLSSDSPVSTFTRDIDASKAPVIEEEFFDFTLNTLNE